MSTVTAILRTYRAPREVMATHRAAGADEASGLTWLFVACILFFVARLPEVSRQSHLAGLEGVDTPVASLALPLFYGTVLMAPLMFLLIAALSHLIARVFGGKGTWRGARLALFWSLLCTTPFVLFQGLIAGFIGPGAALTAASLLVFSVFIVIWMYCLIEMESQTEATT